MSKLRFILWFLIAWPLPALIAGAMGWAGVWGSGSALGDYLFPIPVAGGVLHVPSFLVCSAIVWNMPKVSALAVGHMRAFLLGVALAGVLLLLKVDAIWLSYKTQSSFPIGIWQSNPLGLFFLSDALVATLLTLGATRDGMRLTVVSLMLVVLPAGLPMLASMQYSSAGKDFLPGARRQGLARSDEVNMVFTSLDINNLEFLRRAEEWVGPSHPRFSSGSDDAAYMFTRNLDAARNFDTSKVVKTLCLYEDGTPATWISGAASDDCFESHVSFSDRFQSAYAARPAVEPVDLKDYMSRKDICVGVKTIGPSGDTGGIELSGMRICNQLQELRESLLKKYPEVAALRD
jgi:hypothetical protein